MKPISVSEAGRLGAGDMIEQTFELRLAEGLRLQIHRIGYADEGIRLTVYQGMPFNCHFEVQLSRRDAEQLIAALRQELDNPHNANLHD